MYKILTTSITLIRGVNYVLVDAAAVAQLDQYGSPRMAVDYQVDQVCWKVAKIIIGYTDYVRREVWNEGVGNEG